jgi:hypothetical protein
MEFFFINALYILKPQQHVLVPWEISYPPTKLLVTKVLPKTYFLAVLAKKEFPLNQNQLDGTRI